MLDLMRRIAGSHTHTFNSHNPLARCETAGCWTLRLFCR